MRVDESSLVLFRLITDDYRSLPKNNLVVFLDLPRQSLKEQPMVLVLPLVWALIQTPALIWRLEEFVRCLNSSVFCRSLTKQL